MPASTYYLLGPSKGGLCITYAALKPADIIVSTSNGVVSRLIRGATNSAVSHVMLYQGWGQVVEAIEEGVVSRPLTLALADATLAVAYRRKGMSEDAVNAVLAFARALATKKVKYDYRGAVGGGASANPTACLVTLTAATGLATRMAAPLLAKVACQQAAKGKLNDPDKYYCSELVLEAFQKAGVAISGVSPSISVPQQIVDAYRRGVLEYLGHLR